MDFLNYLALENAREDLMKKKRPQFPWVQMQLFKNI